MLRQLLKDQITNKKAWILAVRRRSSEADDGQTAPSVQIRLRSPSETGISTVHRPCDLGNPARALSAPLIVELSLYRHELTIG